MSSPSLSSLNALIEAGTGAAAVISAPAGHGKSVLLDSLERRAIGAGWVTRRATHDPAGRYTPLVSVSALFGAPAPTATLVETAHSLYWVCANLTRERPLALFVDDAQWADRASLKALAQLARRTRELPLLVVLAARPNEGDATPDVAVIFDRIASARILRPSRLSEPARRLSQALAVLPDDADDDLLSRVTGLDARELSAARSELEPGEWRSHAAAEAVRRSLDPDERERLYRAVVRALIERREAPEVVAPYVLECTPAGDQVASEVLQARAARALEQGATRVAAVHLERALLERAPADDRADLLAQLGGLAFHAGLPAARARLHEALGESGDRARRVEILTRLASLHAIDGGDLTLEDAFDDGPDLDLARVDALLAHPERHAERVRRTRALGEHGDARAHRAWLGVETGTPDAGTCAGLARSVLEDTGVDRPAFHLAVRTLILTDRVSQAGDAIAHLRDEGTERGSVTLRAAAAWYAAALALRVGRLADAEREARLALELGAGSTVFARGALYVLVAALAERGADAEARVALLERGVDVPAGLWLAEDDSERAAIAAREAGWRRTANGQANPARSAWRSALALALTRSGRCEEAAAVADDEIALARAFGAPTALARALHARCVAEPELEGRAELAAAALAVRTPATVLRARAQVELGSTLVRLGRGAEAREPLQAALAAAGAAGALELAEHARRALLATVTRSTTAEITRALRAAA